MLYPEPPARGSRLHWLRFAPLGTTSGDRRDSARPQANVERKVPIVAVRDGVVRREQVQA